MTHTEHSTLFHFDEKRSRPLLATLSSVVCLAWLVCGTPYPWAGPLWQLPPEPQLHTFAAIRLLPVDLLGTACGVVGGVLVIMMATDSPGTGANNSPVKVSKFSISGLSPLALAWMLAGVGTALLVAAIIAATLAPVSAGAASETLLGGNSWIVRLGAAGIVATFWPAGVLCAQWMDTRTTQRCLIHNTGFASSPTRPNSDAADQDAAHVAAEAARSISASTPAHSPHQSTWLSWVDALALPLALLPVAQSVPLAGVVDSSVWFISPVSFSLTVGVVALLAHAAHRFLLSRGKGTTPGDGMNPGRGTNPGTSVVASTALLAAAVGILFLGVNLGSLWLIGMSDSQGNLDQSSASFAAFFLAGHALLAVVTALWVVGVPGLLVGCGAWIVSPIVAGRVAHGMSLKQQDIVFRSSALIIGGLLTAGFVFAGGGFIPSFSLHTGHALVDISALPHPPLKALYHFMGQQHGVTPYPLDMDVPLDVAVAPFPTGGGLVLAVNPATLLTTLQACIGVWILMWAVWPAPAPRLRASRFHKHQAVEHQTVEHDAFEQRLDDAAFELKVSAAQSTPWQSTWTKQALGLPSIVFALGVGATLWMLLHLDQASPIIWPATNITSAPFYDGTFMQEMDYTPRVVASNSFQDAHAVAICCFSFLIVHTVIAKAVQRTLRAEQTACQASQSSPSAGCTHEVGCSHTMWTTGWVWAALAAAWWPTATGVVQTLSTPAGWAVSISPSGPGALLALSGVCSAVIVITAVVKHSRQQGAHSDHFPHSG